MKSDAVYQQCINARCGATYAADELVSETGWQLLGISPKRDGLTMTLTDPTATLVRQRFYRIEPR